MKYNITFVSTGGVAIEANSEDEAMEIFENEMQEAAEHALLFNGIDITEISELED